MDGNWRVKTSHTGADVGSLSYRHPSFPLSVSGSEKPAQILKPVCASGFPLSR
jgi:hypothetical protein